MQREAAAVYLAVLATATMMTRTSSSRKIHTALPFSWQPDDSTGERVSVSCANSWSMFLNRVSIWYLGAVCQYIAHRNRNSRLGILKKA